jgi:hypothetical protein
MSADNLTPEARRENATTLAEVLGIHVSEAAKALELSIVVTADPGDDVAHRISQEVISLLSRTVRSVSTVASGHASTELVVGSSTPQTRTPAISAHVAADRVVIGRNVSTTVCAKVPAILCLLAACYASAAALYHALGGGISTGLADPLVIDFAQLGIDIDAIQRPVDLGHAYLAGAGAIGNGLLWAARYLDIRGRLEIVDDDKVSSGNLNRQIWFEARDIDSPKAECLARKAQPLFPCLVLIPRYCRLQDLPEKSDKPWLRRLIVAVDSRRARRSLQSEMPGEVFDASTTDIREVILHHHSQPTDSACLSCIYEPDNDELTREQHIADHLGVSVAMVRAERISASAAEIITHRYPGLAVTRLMGTAYDTLFKQLCAEGQLEPLAGRPVIAPFAFVSVLAGTMLALELVRRLSDAQSVKDFNYWRISPWHSLLARRRMLRPRQPNCQFCGDAILKKVNAALWPATASPS